ncbi:hypothetical protein N7524_012161 [Penicillium chrysogenum]|nr:hypothetical protein N7524_012161 [Penicillium chrysogenum]
MTKRSAMIPGLKVARELVQPLDFVCEDRQGLVGKYQLPGAANEDENQPGMNQHGGGSVNGGQGSFMRMKPHKGRLLTTNSVSKHQEGFHPMYAGDRDGDGDGTLLVGIVLINNLVGTRLTLAN